MTNRISDGSSEAGVRNGATSGDTAMRRLKNWVVFEFARARFPLRISRDAGGAGILWGDGWGHLFRVWRAQAASEFVASRDFSIRFHPHAHHREQAGSD